MSEKSKYKFLVSYYYQDISGHQGYAYQAFSSKIQLFNLFGNDNFAEREILRLNPKHKNISFIAVSEIFNDYSTESIVLSNKEGEGDT